MEKGKVRRFSPTKSKEYEVLLVGTSLLEKAKYKNKSYLFTYRSLDSEEKPFFVNKFGLRKEYSLSRSQLIDLAGDIVMARVRIRHSNERK